MKKLIMQKKITENIFIIRGHKIMLSTHLAKLYDVETRVLVQAVKRNIERFPKDFMFQLSNREYQNLKSQIVTSSWGGSRRANPYAFTEQGVAMLSSVLKSKSAIQVNIAIMRTFVKLRELISTHKDLLRKLILLEKRVGKHSKDIEAIFDAIRQLITPSEKPKTRIGFHNH
ncbi:MAG: ORF6N domain-containing protein [Candidatus Kaelpia imicola]|nr:ORF6N domain-containing protein [Candidatus Kaelpia imicola]